MPPRRRFSTRRRAPRRPISPASCATRPTRCSRARRSPPRTRTPTRPGWPPPTATAGSSIPALPPGTYDVSVKLSGFAGELEGVTLALGSRVDLPFALNVSGTAETITVTAPRRWSTRRRPAVATVVSQQQIESLPIDGRNFISFAVITPGVYDRSHAAAGRVGDLGPDLRRPARALEQHHGGRADNNDSWSGSVRATFSQEAVREFQVLTNSYSAEFGKATGGVRQHRDQERHEPVRPATCSSSSATRRSTRKGHFEKVDPSGEPDRSREGAVQPGAVRRHARRADPAGQDVLLPVVRAARHRASNFVTIDDRTSSRTRSSARRSARRRRFCAPPGFRSRPATCRYAVRTRSSSPRSITSSRRTRTWSLRFNYGDAFNENIEPFGGITARSRAAALDARDYMWRPRTRRSSRRRWVNELRFQFALSRSERAIARSAVRRRSA